MNLTNKLMDKDLPHFEVYENRYGDGSGEDDNEVVFWTPSASAEGIATFPPTESGLRKAKALAEKLNKLAVKGEKATATAFKGINKVASLKDISSHMAYMKEEANVISRLGHEEPA